MNKPLLLSLAAATILGTNLNAESMYERIQAMELQMKQMQQEIKTLKAEKGEATQEDEDETTTAIADDEADEDEGEADSDDTEDESDDDEEETIEEQIADMQESITELNKGTNGNHLKFGVDYRFAIENIQYKMAAQDTNGEDKFTNDAFMTNRFWLNMNWAATENLSFHGQLAYNKAFGARSGASPATAGMEGFDWIANENAFDDKVRVRSVYFLYKNDEFLGADMPWTFSIGRRPSTNGHLVNLRDDDHQASPMGHNINVEFDGLSAKFGLENITNVDGMYVKFCAGRGMSNAQPMFSPNGTPFASDETANPDIDLIGLIFVPYDNGQYSFNTQYYYANNLIDQHVDNTGTVTGDFDTVGGLHAITANIKMDGIGDEWSDFLDDTVFFLSGAMSITDPSKTYEHWVGNNYVNAKGMLGSEDSETGYSVWVGTQFPSLITEDGRWGLEYNWGSQYWRSMTYGEDTNIGSKLAARGNAYEAYFTEYLVDDILSMQIRYTFIDYDYRGSNGFFGNSSGNAMTIDDAVSNGLGAQTVDTAQDIRFYLRYKY